MKKRTYFEWWYILVILFIRSVFSLMTYFFIVETNLIFLTAYITLIHIYLFMVSFIRMCFGKIVIEENKITIYKTEFYPECKGIRKIRKKSLFSF